MGARPVLLALVLLAASAAARAQERPLPSPSPSASPRPVSESIEPVVERMENERKDPCLKAKAEGRPCFPVTAIIRGPEYSVRQSLGILGDPEKPVHTTAPTTNEMKEYRPGSQTPIAGVSFDPVCAAKALLKGLKGKNTAYYLYVIRDTRGARAQLYDHKLDPVTFQGELAFVGRYEGECEAVAAWRHEDLKLQPAVRGPIPPAPAAASPRPR